jgi:sugar lactone lactonase YvrE
MRVNGHRAGLPLAAACAWLLFAAGMVRGQSAPTITQQPANQTNYAGGNAEFTVAVSGAGPFEYQWQFDGVSFPLNGVITTVAGNGADGFSGDGAAATNASLGDPSGVAADSFGNVFIADTGNDRVRKVDANGIITTIVSNIGAYALAFDLAGDLLVSDDDARVWALETNGNLTAVAGNGTASYSGDGGAATNAGLLWPQGLAVDNDGNIYIADSGNGRIRKVDGQGIITTIAGGGTNEPIAGEAATNASFSDTTAVAVDASGKVYVGDSVAQNVWEVDANGLLLPGPSGAISLFGLAIDAAGNLFIADQESYVWEALTGSLSVQPVAGNGTWGYSGDGGPATNANLTRPQGVALDPAGDLFIADTENCRLREVIRPGPPLNLSNVSVFNSGSYDVVVVGSSGSVTSGVANLTVLGPPAIASQPTNQVIPAGSNVTFSVAAIGPPPSQFQWYFDGAEISGETNASLSLASLYLTNAGGYSVVVSNLYGSVTSSTAALTVSVITRQPTNQTALVGSNAAFSVTTVGTEPYNYQWFFDGGALLGQTNGVLSFDPVQSTNAGSYEVVVSNVYATVTSSAATLKLVYVPVIVIQPLGLTNLAGTSASLSVTASGTGPFTYQWQQNGTNLPNGIITTVAGGGTASENAAGEATNARLTSVPDVAVDTSGNFFIVDTASNRIYKVAGDGIIGAVAGSGTNGFAGDGKAALNADLSHPTGVAVDSFGNLFIADNGNNRIRKVLTNGTITTVAGNGTAAYGGDGSAATNASLFLSALPTFSAISSGVALDANGNLFIADTYNNRVRRVGTNGIITTVAGKGPQGYSGDGGPATNAELSQPQGLAIDASGDLFVADTGNKRVREVGAGGIIVTVAGGGSSRVGGPATNASLLEPAGVALDAGGNLFISDASAPDEGLMVSSLVFEVWTNGIITRIAGEIINLYPLYGDGGPATNAFLRNPIGLAVDTNRALFIADTGDARVRKVVIEGPVLSFDNLTTDNAGSYDVIVTGPYGSVTSGVVSLTVLSPAAITAQPQNQFVPIGSNAAFNVAASGTPPLAYQWYFDGAALAGQTNSALDIIMTSLTNAGSYEVVVTNVYGAAASRVANLSVGVPPQITLQPQSASSVAGGNAALTVTVSGTGPLSYQWQLNGTNLPSRTITTFAGGGSHLGDGGPATNATLAEPRGLATDPNGNLFIADYGDNRIREIGTRGVIATVAGNGTAGDNGVGGPATQANVREPIAVALDASGNLFVIDSYARVCRVGTNGLMTDEWTTNFGFLGINSGLAVDSNDTVFVSFENEDPLSGANAILEIASNGTLAGRATNAELGAPMGLALDAGGNLFIADETDGYILRLGANGIFTAVAGNGHSGFSGDGGPATNALLNGPHGLAVDALGDLFIADTGNNRIREVFSNGIILTVAGDGIGGYSGDGGTATAAALNQPYGVAVDLFGNLFIADTDNDRIRLAAQGPVFALANVSLTNAGTYDVVVSSPYGAVTSAVAVLTVYLPPQNLSASFTAGPGVELQWNGTPGYLYVLLTTTNLAPPVTWQPLVTNAADSHGNWHFIDTNVAHPARFYRALAP